MYPDYQSLVLSAYQNGCSAQTLSLYLRNPTPANLRDACAETCRGRFDRKDQQTLSAFFGPFEGKPACLQAIERCDIDKFKPLLKFIKGQVRNPHHKHVELLAWLVDVQPRPYQHGFDYERIHAGPETLTNEQSGTAVGPTGTLEIVLPATGDLTLSYQSFLQRRSRLLVFVSVLLTLVTGLAWWWVTKPAGNCMYWDSDHYELVACDKKMPGILVIAADNNMLINFKKINREDTITAAALGHVWYSKINNLVEYFTADGYHPVQIQYHLKPLTQYMIAHHLQ